MGRLIKTGIFILTLGLLVSPVLLIHSISADHPIVQTTMTVDSATVARVKRIVNQVEYAAYFSRRSTLNISQDDLDGMLALAARAIQRINAAAHISPLNGTVISLALHIPENPLGKFINIRLTQAPNSNGIDIRQLEIGKLSFHGKTAQKIVKTLMSYLLGKEQSRQLLNAVKTIRTQNNRVLIQYQGRHDLGKIIARGLNHSGLFGGDLKTLSDPKAIQFYYGNLCQRFRSGTPPDLDNYLAPLFLNAAQRSNTPQQAVMENRAALVALAIFFGSYKFNTIINAIPEKELDRCQYPKASSLLAGREDLSLHFIFSAMIKIMSDNDISFAMGEFKELGDSVRGGSGFSFADLAADQAGIQFAEFATHPDTSLRIHKKAELLRDEASFFPDLAQLAEGLSQQKFEQEYGGIEGENYKMLVREIRGRINRLALYQDTP